MHENRMFTADWKRPKCAWPPAGYTGVYPQDGILRGGETAGTTAAPNINKPQTVVRDRPKDIHCVTSTHSRVSQNVRKVGDLGVVTGGDGVAFFLPECWLRVFIL